MAAAAIAAALRALPFGDVARRLEEWKIAQTELAEVLSPRPPQCCSNDALYARTATRKITSIIHGSLVV